MKINESSKQLLQAMNDFSAYYSLLKIAIDNYEQQTGESVNDLPGFTKWYPFDKSLDELTIRQWVCSTVEEIRQRTFKVLNYQYLNTGGNTMVGIHEVWLPAEKRTVYVYTNEEGCTMALVDYIRHDVEIDDYDEVTVDYVDFGRITGREKYFELYKYCFNEYLKDDCKYFKYTRSVQPMLLSDDLQKQISANYLEWIHAENGDLVETDGQKIVVNDNYNTTTVHGDWLQAVKDFQKWHDTIAGDEKYYNEDYKLMFADHEVKLPFNADVWDAVDTLLTRTIEEW